MLFGKKKCQYCGSDVDKALTTCPVCGNEVFPDSSNAASKTITWIPWFKEIILFLMGSVGLTIAATAVQIVFLLIDPNQMKYDNAPIITNFIAYFVVFSAISALIWMHHHELFKSFKRWQPYIIGLAGVAALMTFNVIYGNIVSLIFPMTDNTNETAVNSYILNTPLLAFVVVVLLGPVCEELTYRVGLFSFFSRIHIALGYVLTALIFGLIHFDWTSFTNASVLINELLNLPSYIFAGLVFSFLYHKWGLACSLSAHLTNNLLSFIFVILAGVFNG